MGPFDSLDSKCGCGKAVRYTTRCGKGACNKYLRCASYEELDEMHTKLAQDYSRLMFHAINLTLYRDGTELHDKACKFVEKLNERTSV